MIELSARVQVAAGLSARRDPQHQAPADRGGHGRDRPRRGRQRHAAAGRSRSSAMTEALRRSGATASTASSRAAGVPAGGSRAGSSAASACGSIRPPRSLPLIGSKEGLSHLPFAVVNPGDVDDRARAGLPGLPRRLAPRRRRAVHRAAAAGERLPARPGAGSRRRCCGGPSWCSSTIPTIRRPRWRTPEYLERTVADLPAARDPAGLRQRLLRSHLRRLPRAEHLRDPGRARGGARVLLAVQELLDDRLAARLRGRDAPS